MTLSLFLLHCTTVGSLFELFWGEPRTWLKRIGKHFFGDLGSTMGQCTRGQAPPHLILGCDPLTLDHS